MKTAVMQPYIFPYIGYYQLIDAVDNFVIFDDVNFIMRGWINRNNILLDGNKHLFSIPLEKPSQNKLICDTKLSFSEKEKIKFLKVISFSYVKSPYFKEVFPLIEEIITYKDNDLVNYLQNSLIKICEYSGIKTNIFRSSEIEHDLSLRAESKIIDLCKKLNTNIYVNLPGGRTLYKSDNFEKNGMDLAYINTFFDKITYKQYKNDFVANLSFLDLMMFNSKIDLGKIIKQYDIQK